MQQVLFEIPGLGQPIYGYGVMLALAILLCVAVASKLANESGIPPLLIQDLAMWLVVAGILGARLFFFIQYRDRFPNWWDFFKIWEGGLVVYGSAMGAFVAFIAFTAWKRLPRLLLLDVIAPSLALGMALGRLGCFLNGCCYGDFCQHNWAVTFPPASPPQQRMVETHMQTRFGMILLPGDDRILAVEAGSDAQRQGIRPGDRIRTIDGVRPQSDRERRLLWLMAGLPEGERERIQRSPWAALQAKKPMVLEVRRGEEDLTFEIAPARSLPIHPTQLYSSIGSFLLFIALLAYFPLRRRDGELIAAFVLCYSVGRFLIEYLRFDEKPLADGLTISQNVSIVFFLVGLGLLVAILRRPKRTQAAGS